jgi:hypothetical protein
MQMALTAIEPATARRNAAGKARQHLDPSGVFKRTKSADQILALVKRFSHKLQPQASATKHRRHYVANFRFTTSVIGTVQDSAATVLWILDSAGGNPE